MAFTTPDLPYAYDALEPHIDKTTMEIHHDKHHTGYTKKLNAAIEGTALEGKSLEEIFANVSKHPAGVRNNGGGHYNHSLFWPQFGADGGGQPTGKLADAITEKFGNFGAFQEEFETAAKTRFGSGWAWLGVKNDGSLCVCSSPNQDNPLMDVADCPCTPILGIDVWEHAYYLKYQNKRPDYVKAFWNIVKWDVISERFEKANS